MWQCHQTASSISSISEPTLQRSSLPLGPSHGSLSRAGGCQGGKAGGRALRQPWATGHRGVRATAFRHQLSLPGERGSPLGTGGTHRGLSLPSPSTPAQLIGKCSRHFLSTHQTFFTLWKRRETDAYNGEHCPRKKTCSVSSKINRNFKKKFIQLAFNALIEIIDTHKKKKGMNSKCNINPINWVRAKQ